MMFEEQGDKAKALQVFCGIFNVLYLYKYSSNLSKNNKSSCLVVVHSFLLQFFLIAAFLSKSGDADEWAKLAMMSIEENNFDQAMTCYTQGTCFVRLGTSLDPGRAHKCLSGQGNPSFKLMKDQTKQKVCKRYFLISKLTVVVHLKKSFRMFKMLFGKLILQYWHSQTRRLFYPVIFYFEMCLNCA